MRSRPTYIAGLHVTPHMLWQGKKININKSGIVPGLDGWRKVVSDCVFLRGYSLTKSQNSAKMFCLCVDFLRCFLNTPRAALGGYRCHVSRCKWQLRASIPPAPNTKRNSNPLWVHHCGLSSLPISEKKKDTNFSIRSSIEKCTENRFSRFFGGVAGMWIRIWRLRPQTEASRISISGSK